MSKEKVTSGGISFGGVLFLIFLVLKLTNNIDWSWWWVTAPLWGGVALILGVVLLIFIIAFGTSLIKNLFKKKNN